MVVVTALVDWILLMASRILISSTLRGLKGGGVEVEVGLTVVGFWVVLVTIGPGIDVVGIP